MKQWFVLLPALYFIHVFVVVIAYAHNMLIEPQEEGTVKVFYDDGSISARTTVTVLDSEGNEIEQGPVDDNGLYQYNNASDAAKIVADDGMGHRAEWAIGEEISATTETQRWHLISGVVVIFLAIAVIFGKRRKEA